jgi:hypothetical protein
MFVRSFMCVAVVLGMVASASAELIYTIGLDYQKSYLANSNTSAVLPYTETVHPDGTITTQITPNGLNVIHEFKMYLTANNMELGQDILYMQYVAAVSGGTTMDGGFSSSGGTVRQVLTPTNPLVAPPVMGAGGLESSVSADPASPTFVPTWASTIYAVGTKTFAFDLTANPPVGDGWGDTYGDVAAFVQPGEGGRKQIGTVRVMDIFDAGTFGLTFPDPTGTGKFKIINGNVDGVGTINDAIYPSFAGRSDLVMFVIPEPGTLLLLATGLLGLVCYAWRKRK